MKQIQGHPQLGFDFQIEDAEYLCAADRDIARAIASYLGATAPMALTSRFVTINAQGNWVLDAMWVYVPALGELLYVPSAVVALGTGQAVLLRWIDVPDTGEPRLQSDDTTTFPNRISREGRWVAGPPGGAGVAGYIADYLNVQEAGQLTGFQPAVTIPIPSHSFTWDAAASSRVGYRVRGAEMAMQINIQGTIAGASGTSNVISFAWPSTYRLPANQVCTGVGWATCAGVSALVLIQPNTVNIGVLCPTANLFQAGALSITGQVLTPIQRA